MAAALLTHREGVVPFWTGDSDLQPRLPGPSFNQTWTPGAQFELLRVADPIPREVVIDDRLFHRFRPVGNRVVCPLLAGGSQILATIGKPKETFFVKQLEMVREHADLREDRFSEILVQTEDILSFFASVLRLDYERCGWVMELLEAVVRLCGYVEFPMKFDFDVPRPSQLSSKVQPCIGMPGHGSYPSGHATESFAVATVLAGLLHRWLDDPTDPGTFRLLDKDIAGLGDKPAAMLLQSAMRIANNRVVAGVHYPHDGVAGAVLGVAIGEAIVNYASGAQATTVYSLQEPASQAKGVLTVEVLGEVLGPPAGQSASFSEAPSARDGLLRDIWKAALCEMPAEPK